MPALNPSVPCKCELVPLYICGFSSVSVNEVSVCISSSVRSHVCSSEAAGRAIRRKERTSIPNLEYFKNLRRDMAGEEWEIILRSLGNFVDSSDIEKLYYKFSAILLYK